MVSRKRLTMSNWNKRLFLRKEAVALSFLKDILKAQTVKEKRKIIATKNPHFYLMFHGGVANKTNYESEVCDGLSE